MLPCYLTPIIVFAQSINVFIPAVFLVEDTVFSWDLFFLYFPHFLLAVVVSSFWCINADKGNSVFFHHTILHRYFVFQNASPKKSLIQYKTTHPQKPNRAVMHNSNTQLLFQIEEMQSKGEKKVRHVWNVNTSCLTASLTPSTCTFSSVW